VTPAPPPADPQWRARTGWTSRLKLKMRACYCSVFDECWETDLVQTSAQACQELSRFRLHRRYGEMKA
jgi:hypothetical protein